MIDYLDEWAFMYVADVILLEIPVLSNSAQWPIVSTWCMVRSVIAETAYFSNSSELYHVYFSRNSFEYM